MTPETEIVSLERFLEMDKGKDRLEYFNGEVIYLPPPSIDHQRVLLNMGAELRDYFKGKPYEAFISPLDLWLINKEKALNVKVQPDLMVICDKAGLRENSYYGAPALIIEVISSLNETHDRVRKYSTYMEFGIKEYWMINPRLKTIEVYLLEEDEYKQAAIYKGDDCAVSQIFGGLKIHLEEVFSNE
ncbi:Endonuclease, Uma2 family (restriction endonuclease fold) [Caloramator quimbayensis]|uniref:Endonuclease, Uma2 family (Restriction endonuclease fold) n=1 Tax=Caloramator quimbayensis TaxID=1147123 RepID=A0A1T4XEF3_9CLOT|nr:Uma2 family endonuclease [Caloramator quimbayensis]SKA87485.1 Endonuclease, Uma2 family (restriction endonuclease fold) [Caloramator quimbayensis]